MSIKILRANYGSADVTKKVQELICKFESFKVSNENFGDPDFGVRKKFECEFENEKGVKVSLLFYEGETANLNCVNKTDRLAIYYTDNTKPKLLEKTLPLVIEGANTHNVQLIVSSFKPIEFKVQNIISLWQERGYPTLTTQIIQALLHAKKLGTFKYVSFLEHDVLYAPDYFEYQNFEKTVLHNTNYIGVSAAGFQKFGGLFPPLSQLTLKFDFALTFYEKQLRDRFILDNPIWIEPIHEERISYQALQPNVHINHASFTDHRTYFAKDLSETAPYWGNFKECWVKED